MFTLAVGGKCPSAFYESSLAPVTPAVGQSEGVVEDLSAHYLLT